MARPTPQTRPDTRGDGLFARLLRTPLLVKIVLLDLVIDLATFFALQSAPADLLQELSLLSGLVVTGLNAALIAWALQPLSRLESTAHAVSRGDFGARTQLSSLADRNLARIARTFDALLDRVAEDRSRLRSMAAKVVEAADTERAAIARELHDGTAQSLSALDMLVVSAIAGASSPAETARLATMREVVQASLNEVRDLSHAMHPRVLDDLGLVAALDQLGRRLRAQSAMDVWIDATCPADLPRAPMSVVYRVSQEALHNVAKYAQAEHVTLTLRVEGGDVVLSVEDDGVGFDVEAVTAERRGIGLFVMEERVGLLRGQFSVQSAPGEGTRVCARIPCTERGTR